MLVYPSTLATGPNASTSCTAGVVVSAKPTSSGAMNAPSGAGPVVPSACTTDGASTDPISSSPPAATSAATCRSTSSRCASETSGPIVTPSACGSPITTRSAILACRAATTGSTSSAGTIARRIAVHFWPALVVSSIRSCFTYASNSGVSGVASGPSTEALIESVSLVNRTPSAVCARSPAAVEALPVNETRSPSRRRSKTPGRDPLTSCRDPSGSSPESTRIRTHASAMYAVGVAGFTIDGTPARNAGANFSSAPHIGKLKALICSATPGRRVYTCRPRKDPSFDSGSTGPSRITRAFGSSRRPLDEYVNSTPIPPSTSAKESRTVEPEALESSYSSSRCSFSTVAICLSNIARWWKVSAPRLRCPTVRA